MTNELITSLVTVGLAIVGVAFLAVIVSKQSNTPQVLSAAGSAFSGALGTALSPITGGGGFGSSFTGGGVSPILY